MPDQAHKLQHHDAWPKPGAALLAVLIGLSFVATAWVQPASATDTPAMSPFAEPSTISSTRPAPDVFTHDAAPPPSSLPPVGKPRLPADGFQATGKPATAPAPAGANTTEMTTETFLDKLMQAESGGRADAKNPRSTALGAFQFIESTFLEVVRRHFAQDVTGMADVEILALRTDRDFARRAALAFTRDNAAALTAEGVAATFPNLRLAFLLGPAGAIRVLQAPPESPLGPLVGLSVVLANPFMVGMTAGDLAARAANDLALPAGRMIARPRFVPSPRAATLAGAVAPPLPSSPIARTAAVAPSARTVQTSAAARRAPAITVLCNRDLPSCRRWITIQTRLAAERSPSSNSRRGLSTAQR
jgi:hypothetical protein